MPLTGTTNIGPDVKWPKHTTRKETTYEVIFNSEIVSRCDLVDLIRQLSI